MKRFTLLSGLILVLASTAIATVPPLINFQGILKDGSGNPVADGSYSVTFTVYDDPSAGTVLWAETTSVTTANGLFTILLGADNPVPDTLFNDSSRYLGIKVGGDPEMTPRQKLSSVGYSYVSNQWTSAGQNLFRLNGNVGIGINAPTAPLQVGSVGEEGTPAFIAGTKIVAQATNADNWTHIAIISGSIGQARLNFGDAFNDDQGSVAYNNSTDVMFFSTAATERMRITSAGNVGIGTINPQSPIVVQGSSNYGVAEVVGNGTNVEASIGFRSSNLTKGALGGWVLGVNNTGVPTNTFSLWSNGAGPVITVEPFGKVGIGTASPTKKLEVAGSIKVGTNDTVFSSNISSNSPLRLNAPAGTTRMFISDAGGVGIGTNSPAAKLHVNGADEGIRIQGTATGASNYAYATFYDAAGTRIGYVGDGSSGDNDLFLSADIGNVNLETAGLRRLTVTQSGNVGIGTGAPAAKLHVVGTAGNATGVWSTVSDRRLKKDIEPIEKALETVERLQGVTFHWKDAEKDAQFGRVRGLIAQDVEKVLPEWIKTDPDGYKRLEPIGVDALLIEAIKELKTENENLKTKVSELDRLQTEMAKLTVLVEKLAAQEEKPAKVLTSTR